MRIPQPPPRFQELAAKLRGDRMDAILEAAPAAWPRDRYLHWDDLRRHPGPKGLTHEEWWFMLKLGRMGKLRPIPLRDRNARPFVFSLPDSLLELLHGIDRGLGSAWTLPAAVTDPAARDTYLVSTLIQEAITSSQLEGAATTRNIAKEMIRTGRPPRNRSERMILNNYLTMQRIRDLRGEALTPELVFELHRRVTEGTLDGPAAAGRFRRADENIRVIDEIDGTVFHDPPAAAELPARIAAMCEFANGRTPGFFLHPVIRGILLHFWLAYDHPFVDGNGRTARALFYWLMLHQGLELFEFISISQILLQAPVRYATAFLHAETDENDLTYFLLHQADVITRAVKALHDYARRKIALLQSTETHLQRIEGVNHRQLALLAHALRKPDTRYTIAGHRQSHNVVYQTARTDLLGLADRGFLTVSKVGHALVFRAAPDLPGKLESSAQDPPGPADQTLPLRLSPAP